MWCRKRYTELWGEQREGQAGWLCRRRFTKEVVCRGGRAGQRGE